MLLVALAGVLVLAAPAAATAPAKPSLTSSVGPTGTTTTSTDVQFAFAAMDGITVEYRCALDGLVTYPCISDYIASVNYAAAGGVTPLALGSHTFSVWAIDLAGNPGAPATFNWTIVDSLPPPPPIPTFTSTPVPNAGTTTSTDASFSFSSAGATSYTCWLDAEPTASCNSGTWNRSGLSISTHTFSVFATNSEGSSAEASFVWTIVPPPRPGTPVFTSTPVLPGGTTTSSDASFSFSSAGATSYTCWLDAEPTASCNSGTWTRTGLSIRTHTFSVYASNTSGDSSTTTFTWTVQAPVEDNLPCNMVGHVHGNQNFQATVSGNKVTVHVEADGNCDYDKKANAVFLHHARLKVEIASLGKLINAVQDGKKRSDVRSVTLTPPTGTTDGMATIKGIWQDVAFVVALTDGAKTIKNDTVQLTYPGFPADVLKAPHADVHLDFK